MAKNVPVKSTNYTLIEMIEGLIRGYYLLTNEYPSKETIGILYAQNALETGSTKKMFNNNIGNIKYIPSANMDNDDVEYMMLAGTFEYIGGKKVVFQPPHRQTWFRSFESLGEGVSHHLAFLRNNKRYAEAWTKLISGDPAGFSKELKKGGYYTASEADYTKLLLHFFNKYMKLDEYDNVIAKMRNEERANDPKSPALMVELITKGTSSSNG